MVDCEDNFPQKTRELVLFLKQHFVEDQEDLLLSKFEHGEVIFLSDIYGDEPEKELNSIIKTNIYESAYLRLLIDFEYVKIKKNDEKINDTKLLYCLLNKGLFCISVDFIMTMSQSELKIFSCDAKLLSFLERYQEDGNIKYLKKTIYGK